MRQVAPLLFLVVSLPAEAGRRADSSQVIQRVPSINEVVSQEGFIPTLSQSETYRPGVVLVPNAQGGHDEVFGDCVGIEPTIKIMSQSSIATSLSAGVSARLSAVRGQVAAGVEKRLSFVDPEQRTIPLAELRASDDCVEGLEHAARFTDLSEAILVYDVLLAQIQNTVCTKADASGSVMMLGEAEAAAFSECVQESDAQVPLGFKSVPISRVLSEATTTISWEQTTESATLGVPVNTSVEFGENYSLGFDAQVKQRECDRVAEVSGSAARAARLSEAEDDLRKKAGVAWQALSKGLDTCDETVGESRQRCRDTVEEWLSTARTMQVTLPAGIERIETECGVRNPEFAEISRNVVADQVLEAERLLISLSSPVKGGDEKQGLSGSERRLRLNPLNECPASVGPKGCVDTVFVTPLRTGFIVHDRSEHQLFSYLTISLVQKREKNSTELAAVSLVRLSSHDSNGATGTFWSKTEETSRGLITSPALLPAISSRSKEHHGVVFSVVQRSELLNGVHAGIVGVNTNSNGVRGALVNVTKESHRGILTSPVGLAPAAYNSATKMTGFQYGVINKAGFARGVQLGIVNVADDLGGFQIGIVNVDKSGRRVPLINWGRNPESKR